VGSPFGKLRVKNTLRLRKGFLKGREVYGELVEPSPSGLTFFIPMPEKCVFSHINIEGFDKPQYQDKTVNALPNWVKV